MIAELGKISGQCDGVRCDMAMLILPEVFERTWGRRPEPFWPKAIASVRRQHPEFLFMAEVYWDLEWTMQQQGFDYAYDKRLYDRLREGHPQAVRGHLLAGLDYQNRLARFLENHDEPRAAATFPPGVHEAAAVVTYLAPGLRFFHQGQFEGRVEAHLAAPDSRSERAGESAIAAVLRAAARAAAATRRPARGMATAGMRTRLGWQLVLRSCYRLRLAGFRWQSPDRQRELCRSSEPVLRPAPVRRPCWRAVAAAGSARQRRSTIATETTCNRGGFTSMCRLGSVTSSR